MKVTASVLLLTAALGVSAHPSGHAHLHNVRRDFVVANKPVTITEYATVPAAAAATSASAVNVNAVVPDSSSAAPAPKSTSASSGSSSGGSKTYQPFCGGKAKRATSDQIKYVGNIGAAGDYGCNLLSVDTSIADKYEHTIAFVNAKNQDQVCKCWNKIGPDGKSINGFFTGNEALTFTLPASGKHTIAVDDNSQGGCACDVGEIELTTYGQFASTWVEFDMANSSNGGWSGADASCLVAAKNGLSIPALKVCGAGTCSTIFEGGEGENAYLKDMEALDGVGLNLPAGEVRLTVTVG